MLQRYEHWRGCVGQKSLSVFSSDVESTYSEIEVRCHASQLHVTLTVEESTNTNRIRGFFLFGACYNIWAVDAKVNALKSFLAKAEVGSENAAYLRTSLV